MWLDYVPRTRPEIRQKYIQVQKSDFPVTIQVLLARIALVAPPGQENDLVLKVDNAILVKG